MSGKAPIIELKNVDKSFGPIDVLHDISLRVHAGEVLCLLGDNGAGKSTLIKTLAGVHQPTRGQILMDGEEVQFDRPKDAQDRGIATVHQFGGTFPLMSIGRSFVVGAEPTKGWGPFRIFDRKKANAIAVKAVQDFGITRIDDGDRLVGGLSGGERQALAIARAVYFGARVLILDEPTAALGVKQASHVLRIVNEAKRRRLADTLGAGSVETDPLAVIARPDVDAVIIASPDPTHAPLSLACLAAGKPALCEKPLSQSSTDCLAVIEAETKAGRRFIQLGFMRRYDQSYAEMKAALDDGTLGRALMMHNFHRNVETPAADFTADMAITNSAPHEFDVARFVLGSDFTSITAFQPGVRTERVGPVFMVLETAAGQLVNIEINNNAAYGYDVRGELVGERGAVSLCAPTFTRRDLALHHQTDYARDWRPRYAEAYRRQNKAFLGFVRTGDFPAIAADAWDGYCAAVVAEAGVRALASAGKMPIAPASRPALYSR